MQNLKFTFVLILTISVQVVFAQEFKTKIDKGTTLKLKQINHVTVEEYDGKELIISIDNEAKSQMSSLTFRDSNGNEMTVSNNGEDAFLQMKEEAKKNALIQQGEAGRQQFEEQNQRREGLRSLNHLGSNTGIGLSLNKKENVMEFQQINEAMATPYIIKVPKGINVSYTTTSPHAGTFKGINISSELEVSTEFSGIYLENVTGPMTVNSVHGNIEAIFGELNQTAPSCMISVHGFIDIALPKETKADVKLKSDWGELLTDLDIKVENNINQDSENSNVGLHQNPQVNGTLNGGGVKFQLSTMRGDIYFRDRKNLSPSCYKLYKQHTLQKNKTENEEEQK